MSKFRKITKKGKIVGNPVRKCQKFKKITKKGKFCGLEC